MYAPMDVPFIPANEGFAEYGRTGTVLFYVSFIPYSANPSFAGMNDTSMGAYMAPDLIVLKSVK